MEEVIYETRTIITPPTPPRTFVSVEEREPEPIPKLAVKPFVADLPGCRVNYGGKAAYVGAAMWYIHTSADGTTPEQRPAILFRRNGIDKNKWDVRMNFHGHGKSVLRMGVEFSEEPKPHTWCWPKVPDLGLSPMERAVELGENMANGGACVIPTTNLSDEQPQTTTLGGETMELKPEQKSEAPLQRHVFNPVVQHEKPCLLCEKPTRSRCPFIGPDGETTIYAVCEEHEQLPLDELTKQMESAFKRINDAAPVMEFKTRKKTPKLKTPDAPLPECLQPYPPEIETDDDLAKLEELTRPA